jgi:glycosyltransferase involved in cell wall biosynthesis
MIRVAAIIASEDVSGPGRQLTAVAAALIQREVAVLPIILQRKPGMPPLAEHMRKHGVRCEVVTDRGPVDAGLIPRLRRVLATWRPHVVQTHCYKATAAGAVLAAFPGATPWAAFYHGSTDKGTKDRLYNHVDRWLLRRADVVVGMSEAHRREFLPMCRSVRVIHNAILPDACAGVTRRSAAGPPVIGLVGRLSHEKGADLLLAALAQPEPAARKWECRIAGDGPERSRLERMADALGIADRVRFLGHITDLPELYSATDLIVLPSRSEGLPNVLLEALYAGRPVLASAVGGIPEVLNPECADYLVPPLDVHALAERLTAWLDGRLPSIAACRTRVLSEFSIERRADAHIQLYDDLLASTSKAGMREIRKLSAAGTPSLPSPSA